MSEPEQGRENHVHVYPVGDTYEHDTDGDDCWCKPETTPVERDDGSLGYVITHNAHDGRE